MEFISHLLPRGTRPHFHHSDPDHLQPYKTGNLVEQGWFTKAKTNRRRMMGESPDCTVLTGTQRFEKKFFPPRFIEGFKEKLPPHVIDEISAAFRDVLVRISNSPASRKPHLLEKELSQAWVRPFRSLRWTKTR